MHPDSRPTTHYNTVWHQTNKCRHFKGHIYPNWRTHAYTP